MIFYYFILYLPKYTIYEYIHKIKKSSKLKNWILFWKFFFRMSSSFINKLYFPLWLRKYQSLPFVRLNKKSLIFDFLYILFPFLLFSLFKPLLWTIRPCFSYILLFLCLSFAFSLFSSRFRHSKILVFAQENNFAKCELNVKCVLILFQFLTCSYF